MKYKFLFLTVFKKKLDTLIKEKKTHIMQKNIKNPINGDYKRSLKT